ncbi:hypothetical protein TNCV_464141 [Trichonephila clavipes]|nr:hypothetical protein TNCV_464141 [Trichonephila clavipes]
MWRSSPNGDCQIERVENPTALIAKHSDAWQTTPAAPNSPNLVKVPNKKQTPTQTQLIAKSDLEHHIHKLQVPPTQLTRNRWHHISRKLLLLQ